MISRADENGWFRSVSPEDPALIATELIGATAVGLSKICIHHSHHVHVERAYPLLLRAAEFSRQAYLEKARRQRETRYVGLPATFDGHWNSADSRSCPAGNAQMAFFWALLGTHAGEKRLVLAARSLVDELESAPLVDIGADALRSRALKLLSDCLMQRLIAPHRLRYLG